MWPHNALVGKPETSLVVERQGTLERPNSLRRQGTLERPNSLRGRDSRSWCPSVQAEVKYWAVCIRYLQFDYGRPRKMGTDEPVC